jgi:hypothetical protein
MNKATHKLASARILLLTLWVVVAGSDAAAQLTSYCTQAIAQIAFTSGLTGRITYDPVMNTSRATFSDGTYSRTTYSDFGSHTTYSDGRTARSTYNEVANRINTTFSDNTTAVTTFSDITKKVVTTFSTGEVATIRYTETATYVESPVCGIFLMPGHSNIIADPKHPAVQEIKRLRSLTPQQRAAEGWVRSGD